MQGENNDGDSVPGDGSKPKKVRMVDLMPPKKLVRTSIGGLFVGAYSPKANIDDSNDEAVGKRVVQQLCSQNEDKQDRTPLPDELLAQLTVEDLATLGPAISQQQGWGDDVVPVTFAAMGVAARNDFKRRNKSVLDEMEKLQKSWKSAYGFLDQSLQDKLTGQLSSLDAVRRLSEGLGPGELLKKYAAEPFKIGSASELLRREMEGGLLSSLQRTDPAAILGTPSSDERIYRTLSIDPPRILRAEDSPLGQATLRSARQLEAATELLTDLTTRMAAMQEIVVGQVLPAWFAKAKEDQQQAIENTAQAKASAANAAQSLLWTKWAVLASVFVTLGTAAWQVYVTERIDAENSKQQARAEELLRSQEAKLEATLKQQQAAVQLLSDLLIESRKRPVPAPSKGAEKPAAPVHPASAATAKRPNE